MPHRSTSASAAIQDRAHESHRVCPAAALHRDGGRHRRRAGQRAGPVADVDRHLPQPEPPGRLRRPAVRRHGPGADGGPAHQLLRISLPLHQRHPPRREPQHPGHGPDEALLPPGHEHGPGYGRGDRLRDPVAGLHAAGHGLAVHHPVRRRQHPGGLPGALQRDEVHRRDPGPGAVQGPADVRQPARGLGAAALRRQPADRRRPARSRPAPRLPDVARRGDPRALRRATRSARRGTSASAR